MKTISNYLYLTITIFSITYISVVHASEKITTEKQIKIIEEMAHEAKNKNALWRDTINVLSLAKQHLANDRHSEAIILLENVEFQLEQAQLQALEQTDINLLIPSYLQN